MRTNYRVFDYNGDTLAVLPSGASNIKELFKNNPEVKRVEVYERQDNESLWDEKLSKTHYAKDFVKGRK